MNIPSYLGGLIQTKAYRVLQGNLFACLQPYDLNPTQWFMVGILTEATEGIRLNEMSELLGVKAPLVTALADDLITKGLITRNPHHSDGRAKLLLITENGRQLASIVEKDLNATQATLLAGLSTQDLATYQRVLETIIANSKAR